MKWCQRDSLHIRSFEFEHLFLKQPSVCCRYQRNSSWQLDKVFFYFFFFFFVLFFFFFSHFKNELKMRNKISKLEICLAAQCMYSKLLLVYWCERLIFDNEIKTEWNTDLNTKAMKKIQGNFAKMRKQMCTISQNVTKSK